LALEEAEAVVRLAVAALAVVLFPAVAFAAVPFALVVAVGRLAALRLAPGAGAGFAADRFAGAFGSGPVVATGCDFGRPLHVGT